MRRLFRLDALFAMLGECVDEEHIPAWVLAVV